MQSAVLHSTWAFMNTLTKMRERQRDGLNIGKLTTPAACEDQNCQLGRGQSHPEVSGRVDTFPFRSHPRPQRKALGRICVLTLVVDLTKIYALAEDLSNSIFQCYRRKDFHDED